MYQIRTYNRISDKGLQKFPRARYEVGEDLEPCQGIILRSYPLSTAEIGEQVLAVARAGAGTNNVPVDYCTQQGIVVFNTPGANANAVKEMVMAALLLSARGIAQSLHHVSSMNPNLSAEAFKLEIEAQKKRFAGGEVKGKTLGVVGLGAIGAQVANMGLSMGMDVIGYDPAISVAAAWRLSSQVQRAENLASLLAKSDFVTLHVPFIEPTRHMIDAKAFAHCKPNTTLINYARGGIVVNEALFEALHQGQIAHYFSDFPSPELLGRDGVFLTPHLGASTREAEQNCAQMAAEQMMDFIDHGNIRNSVNFPEISMERNGGYRLTFANDNVPKVLSQVLDLLSDNNINVIDMLNKSRNDVAYNIIDVEQRIDEALLQQISRLPHIFKLRMIE